MEIKGIEENIVNQRGSVICYSSWLNNMRGFDILEVSGKLNLLMNLNRVPLIVLGFFNFHFRIDFIGGQ